MKYLKKFNTHDEYIDYKESQGFVMPNVSYCLDNKHVDTRIIATLTQSTVGDVKVLNDPSLFTKVWINDVPQETVSSSYYLEEGNYIIKYKLKSTYQIMDNAFTSCNNIISVEIPSSVSRIYRAFQACRNLSSVILSEGLTYISEMAFYNTNILSIEIPSTVTFIGSFSFFPEKLRSITVKNENTTYDSRNNCNAIIETATNKLILGCKNTVIPENIVSIGDSAFSGTDLTNIILPNSVTSIGRSAFSSIESISSIEIPENITSIGDYAFQYCINVTSIRCLPINPPSFGAEVFAYTTGPIYVPSGSVEAYKSALSQQYAVRVQAIS